MNDYQRPFIQDQSDSKLSKIHQKQRNSQIIRRATSTTLIKADDLFQGQLITTVTKDVIILSLGASCTLLLYFGQTVKVKLHCKEDVALLNGYSKTTAVHFTTGISPTSQCLSQLI